MSSNVLYFTENIGGEQKKGLHVPRCPMKNKRAMLGLDSRFPKKEKGSSLFVMRPLVSPRHYRLQPA